jgi:hypothetical protein
VFNLVESFGDDILGGVIGVAGVLDLLEIPYTGGGPGEIHTDFEKGFIRAETIAYADYVALNGEAGARDAGKLRLEGKEYVVADGDVMHFRFNN